MEKARLKRRCEPEDLAGAILVPGLGASLETGQAIVVDGGLTLRPLNPSHGAASLRQPRRRTPRRRGAGAAEAKRHQTSQGRLAWIKAPRPAAG
jgi:hypothetical protein